MNHYTTSIQGTLVKQPVFHRKSCHDFQLVAKSKVGFNSSRLLFLSLRGGRELPGLFGVCTELCVHGALDVAMALRTLGGESDPKISCFDGFWSGPKRCVKVVVCFKHVLFLPRSLREMWSNLTSIFFQMGWFNHQPGWWFAVFWGIAYYRNMWRLW